MPLTLTLSRGRTARAFDRIRPATGFIVVQGFLDPRWLVEIEADAIVGG